MNLVNFNVGDDYISIVVDDIYMDLHNNFDFLGYKYNVQNRQFEIGFEKSPEEWAVKEIYNRIIFVFKEVSFLKIQDGDSSEFPEDEKCLADIGFSSIDMRNDMDSILASNEFKKEYDMIFTFVSGQSIKVHSEEALIETK